MSSQFAGGPWQAPQLRQVRVEVFYEFMKVTGVTATGQRLSDHVNGPEPFLELTDFHVISYGSGAEFRPDVSGAALTSKRSAIVIAETEVAAPAGDAQGLAVAKTPKPVAVYHWPFLITGAYSIPEGAELNRSIGNQHGSFMSLTACKITPVDESLGIVETMHPFVLVNRDLVHFIGPTA